MHPRSTIVSLAALALTAGPAFAQPQTGLFRWQVSRDGLAWTSAVTLAAGDSYKVRGVASWVDGATPSVGFAGCTFEQIDLIGADSSDSFGGAAGIGGTPIYTSRLQGVAETWTIQAGTGASEAGLKIDNINPTNRTNMGQLPIILAGGIPNPNFRRDNPFTVLMFEAVAGDPKTLTISSTWARLGSPTPTNEFKIYTTESGTNKKPVQEAIRTDSVITIIPAPAPLALGFAALARLRRNRR